MLFSYELFGFDQLWTVWMRQAVQTCSDARMWSVQIHSVIRSFIYDGELLMVFLQNADSPDSFCETRLQRFYNERTLTEQYCIKTKPGTANRPEYNDAYFGCAYMWIDVEYLSVQLSETKLQSITPPTTLTKEKKTKMKSSDRRKCIERCVASRRQVLINSTG